MHASHFFIPLILLTGCAHSASNSYRRVPANLEQSAGELSLQDWVKANSTPIRSIELTADTSDLEPIATIYGSASILGLSESGHGLHEVPEFRNRLIAYLVTQKGVRNVMLESGILEGKLVDDFVLGKSNLTIDEVLKFGITHSMGLWEEAKELVLWIKSYNANQIDLSKKVRFHGFDLPVVGDAPILPLQELSSYLLKYDEGKSAHLFYQEHVVPLLALADKAYVVTKAARQGTKEAAKAEAQRKNLNIDLDTVEIDPDDLDAYSTIGYDQLNQDERNSLQVEVKTLVNYMNNPKRARKFTLKSSREEYIWNAHLAEVAVQFVRNLVHRDETYNIWDYGKCLNLLKTAPDLYSKLVNLDPARDVDLNAPNATEAFIANSKGRESRELMNAENVKWANENFGKTFVYAQTGHLLKGSGADVQIKVSNTIELHIGKRGGKGEGQFLNQFYGKKYVLLGETLGQMVNANGEALQTVDQAPFIPVSQCQDCVERAFSSLPTSSPAYVVNLRSVTGPAREWMQEDHQVRWEGDFQKLNLMEGEDAMIYFGTVRPGTKLGAVKTN